MFWASHGHLDRVSVCACVGMFHDCFRYTLLVHLESESVCLSVGSFFG